MADSRLLDELMEIGAAQLAVLEVAARAPGRRITARFDDANGWACAEMERLGWLREVRNDRLVLAPPYAATFVVTDAGRVELPLALAELRARRTQPVAPVAPVARRA
jgi:hypothetical protein